MTGSFMLDFPNKVNQSSICININRLTQLNSNKNDSSSFTNMFRNRAMSQPKYSVNLVFHNGTTRIIMGKQHVPAAEIMLEFPDMMVCPANSFFINHSVPFLSMDEYLVAGQTYLVLPLNCFSSSSSSSSSGHLSISSIAALASTHNKAINFTEKSFQFVKGPNGRALIQVSPEFLTGVLVTGRKLVEERGEEFLGVCSTPELKKHYEQLVGTGKQRNHVWSPKLETISELEYKNRVRLLSFSCRIFGLMDLKKQRELLKNLYKFKLLLRSKELHRIELSPGLV